MVNKLNPLATKWHRGSIQGTGNAMSLQLGERDSGETMVAINNYYVAGFRRITSYGILRQAMRNFRGCCLCS